MRCGLITLVFYLLSFIPATAQMFTLPAAQSVADLPGPPKNPPIFSQMTAILQGQLDFDDSVDEKGSVVQVQRIEQQPQSQNQSAECRVTTFEFDDQKRLIKRIYEDESGTTTMTNTFREDGRLQTQTVDYASANHGHWQEWQHWIYDERGRVSDFRAGRDNDEWNHYLNFKYDDAGRPLGYQYRSGNIAEPPVLTEISYSGRAVTLSRLDWKGHKFFEQVQKIDEQNRVIDLKVSDLSGGELTLWYHVTFKYDGRGRELEQKTDPFKVGSGDDYSPIPGRLIVQYEDEKHLGEQKFFDTDGKLVLHTIFAFDRDGALTKLRVIDASGNEQMSSERFVDAQSHRLTDRRGVAEWEVTYDDHGNWTQRRRWFAPADGSPRILTRTIQQIVKYR